MHFGNLRVINEDFIAAGQGFGKHPHNNMEIITYVISGALSHQDSMGNSSTIHAGEVQVMSAGTGVFHSEFNHEQNQETHLLQIWILPKEKDIAPRYEQKSFITDQERKQLQLVVSGSGREGSLQVNQDVDIFLGKLDRGQDLKIENNLRKVWIQLTKGNLRIDTKHDLITGDAAAVEDQKHIFLQSQEDSEFLLFML